MYHSLQWSLYYLSAFYTGCSISRNWHRFHKPSVSIYFCLYLFTNVQESYNLNGGKCHLNYTTIQYIFTFTVSNLSFVIHVTVFCILPKNILPVFPIPLSIAGYCLYCIWSDLCPYYSWIFEGLLYLYFTHIEKKNIVCCTIPCSLLIS